jgi:glycosyltransferase involved in cell wall biosynthesis
MKEDTAVIIPVFNEEKIVLKVIRSVKKYFNVVICVDDGSSDRSSEVILHSKATLVKHPINLGAGAATQTGIDFALQNKQIKYFVTIDADDQHNIEDALRMLKSLRDNKLDIVFGSRFIGSVESISKFKKLFLKTAAIFSARTSGIYLSDPHIGLRVFNRNFAENLNLTLPDFSHASEIIHRVADGKFKYAEVPVHVSYSDYSKSKGQPMLNSVNITTDLFFHRISKK